MANQIIPFHQSTHRMPYIFHDIFHGNLKMMETTVTSTPGINHIEQMSPLYLLGCM